jgi:hypothetical protein
VSRRTGDSAFSATQLPIGTESKSAQTATIAKP